MSLIFDRFPTVQRAKNFAEFIKTKYGLEGQIFEDPDSAFVHDPFPSELTPPVVHIDRPIGAKDRLKIERVIAAVAVRFGGSFAGT